MEIEQIFLGALILDNQAKNVPSATGKINYSFTTGRGSFLNRCYRTHLLGFDVLFMSVLTFKDLFES